MTSEEMNQAMPRWRTQYELRTGQQSQMTAQQIKIVAAGPPECTTDNEVVDAMIVYAGMDPADYPYADQTLPEAPPPPLPDQGLPGPPLPGLGEQPEIDHELPARPPPAQPKG